MLGAFARVTEGSKRGSVLKSPPAQSVYEKCNLMQPNSTDYNEVPKSAGMAPIPYLAVLLDRHLPGSFQGTGILSDTDVLLTH